MKTKMNDLKGLYGLIMSWYLGLAGLLTANNVALAFSIASSVMTFIYYYRKNKKL